jgi:UDP-N-acetyl-D-mannosaminuronate dehydrogenase
LDWPDEIVAGLKAARSNVDDVTDNDIMKIKCGRFCTVADPNAFALARAVVSRVPTPLPKGGGPDLSGDRGRRERCGTGGVGFLESPTYPGTIDDVVRPVLNASGSVAGVDFNCRFRRSALTRETRSSYPKIRQGDQRPHREMRPADGRFWPNRLNGREN